ncbi:MAG: hypothetical protein QOJ12_255, partial [Thermoleophilales bacterium]|nr:hypothetical protein [Thermoleophilales bacterium]
MVCVAAVGGAMFAGVAHADFPWAGTGSPGTSPCTAPSASDFSKLCTASGQPPTDWTGGSNEFKFAGTPEDSNTNPLLGSAHPGGGPTGVNDDPMELCGVRGAAVTDNHATYMGGCAYPTSRHVDTAWEYTLGRPDVSIAVLDSGIEWDDAGSMLDLRGKVRLNPGELPVPNHNRAPAVDSPPGTTINCTTYTTRHDANGDGVVNVWDYACDDRVNPGTGGSVSQTYGTPAHTMLTPEDLIIAFSKPGSWFGAGKDDDGNGYVNDIAGWDFLDNDNNPYDDVKYGHGTGQAKGSSAEANNGGQTGSCPNCMFVPMRVGDSFIADASRFAQAALYATDNNVDVVQEALGTINNTKLARDAIQYAYDHGVTVIASAADEAAQHHNQVSSLPHTIVVNSVTDYDGTLTPKPQSYLQFNGCTNFSSKVTVAIPSTTCSSNATGMAGGMAGLIYSEAINARDAGKITSTSECRRVNGSRCVITPNEVRQVMASGLLDGSPVADDVNFASPPPGNQPEPVCGSSPAPLCTDPNGALQTQVNANRQNGSPIATTRSYPARKGFDQFYGYGRVNMFNAVRAVANGKLPPEVELTAPDWYDQIDPSKATLDITGHVDARGASYSCRVFVAPGSYPADSAAPAGDFHEVTGALVAGPGPCQGSSRSDAIDGAVAHISIAALKGLFPPTAGSFNGPESGPTNPATANGRPNAEPYGFTVKIVATTADTSASASPGDTLQGQDRRNLFLHRDQDLLAGYPRKLPSDGESSPAFADLAGDNRNEMIFGTADGLVHAMRRDGSEVPGWPVKSDPLPLHTGARAFKSGEVATQSGAILA